MLLTDYEIIKKFDIKPTYRILDVGGSMKQHQQISIDTLVDIIRPEEAPYGKSKLLAKKFVQLDVTKQKLPFNDKEYDFCLCTHTLEDLYNPFLLIDEMSRVAKRGFISTPSMGQDMEYSHFNLTDWKTGQRRVPGIAHHKWFFYEKKGIIQIIPKNYPILYSSKFHITKWLGDSEFQYFWEEKIRYKQIKDLSIHKLIKEYSTFIDTNIKYIKKGPVLVYLDNPFYFLKEFIKVLLKR
jgi:ubiquinone/menaquinone biosynthesis C-methylase UbiE